MSVVVAQRIRMFGLDEWTASHELSGTFLGRLYLLGRKDGGLDRDQFLAARQYLDDRDAYLRAIGRNEYDRHRPETHGEGDYEDFCTRAKDRWKLVRDVLRELILEQDAAAVEMGRHGMRAVRPGPEIIDSLDKILVQDREYWPYVGPMRLALNRLAKFYFESKRRAA